jgi:hypothetical protein
MGQQSDPRNTSRSQKDENDTGQGLSCQQLERRFQELLRLREKVRVAQQRKGGHRNECCFESLDN